MENLDVENKKLADENERLKKQNAQLLTRIHTLEVEVKYSLFSAFLSQQIPSE